MIPTIIALSLLAITLSCIAFKRCAQWRKNNNNPVRGSDDRYLWVWSGEGWLALTEKEVGKAAWRAKQNEEDAP